MLAIADLKWEDANVKYRLVGNAVMIAAVAAVIITPFKHAVAQSGADAPGKNANKWCIGCSIDGKTTPRTADGHPDFSGFWINPESGHIASLSPDGSKLFDFAGEETAGQRGASGVPSGFRGRWFRRGVGGCVYAGATNYGW